MIDSYLLVTLIPAACVGHWLLFAAAVNRLQATGLGKAFDTAVTLGHWGLLPLVPLVFLATERPWEAFFHSSGEAGPSAAWGVYGAACLIWLGGTIGERSWRRLVADAADAGGGSLAAVELPDATPEPEPDRAGHPLAWLTSLPGNESRHFEVRRYDIELSRLPAAAEGVVIAHLGDLHLTGDVGYGFHRRVAEVVGDARPDLIVLSGDLLDRDDGHEVFSGIYGGLSAPLGVAFVLGNHDARHLPEQTRRTLAGLGWRDLGGRAEAVGDGAVFLAGDERPWFRHEPPEVRHQDGAVRILVSHSPDNFSAAVGAGYDLVLSGHNHGGQVRLPGLGAVYSPSRTGTRYACGLFRRGGTTLHVTRGLGAQIPLRYRCPPELAFLTLRRA